VESRNRLSTEGHDPLNLTLKTRLELLAKKSAWSFFASVEGSLEGAAHYWPGSHQRGRAGLRELYVTYDAESFDFWLGRKLHPWGTSDGYNPLDLFNPIDYNDPFISGRSINRVPQWMAGFDLTIGPLNFEALALPLPGVMEMPEPGEPWEPRAYRQLRALKNQGVLALNRDNAPGRYFKDGDYGLRVSTVWSGFDLSLMGFRGYFDEPLFHMALSPYGLKAMGEYARYSAYGASWAKGLGSQTLRGEVVYIPDFPVQGPVDWQRGRLIQAVVGWDRDFDSQFYLNLQYLAEFQGRAGHLPPDDRQGLTYEASTQWAMDVWKAGVRGQVYTTGDGSLNELFLEYQYDDHLKFLAGLMVFSGPNPSILGQFRENDFFYLTVRYSF
jgi:hypothetical protein